MSDRAWRGSFAIPMTPYDTQDRIDEDVLRAEIEFCIQSGVGGIVVPVMVSEFRVLSEDERRTMVRMSAEVSNGRVPIVANCAAVNTPLAVSFARYAQEVGADASRLGADGARTKMLKLFIPVRELKCEFVEGEDEADAAVKLALKLREVKLI